MPHKSEKEAGVDSLETQESRRSSVRKTTVRTPLWRRGETQGVSDSEDISQTADLDWSVWTALPVPKPGHICRYPIGIADLIPRVLGTRTKSNSNRNGFVHRCGLWSLALSRAVSRRVSRAVGCLA